MSVTEELRELLPLMPCGRDEMAGIADRIDAEHERLVGEVRHEMAQYMRDVILDYERGDARVRKGDMAEVVHCVDCRWSHVDADHIVCLQRPLMAHYVEADDYCSRGESVAWLWIGSQPLGE